MSKLNFDDGIETYNLSNGAKLRINFSDFNLYDRFAKLQKDIDEIQEKHKEEINNLKVEELIPLFVELDKEIKEKLQNVFGKENNFDEIFSHQNCFAVNSKNRFIIEEFVEAIRPIIEKAGETQSKVFSGLVGNREERRKRNHE